MAMAIKLGIVVTYHEGFSPIKSHDPLIMWSCIITLSYIILLYEKLKNYSIQSFKECLFFVFCLFRFFVTI